MDTTTSAAVNVIWSVSLLITLGKLTGQAGNLTMLNCYPSCWCRSQNTSWGLSDSWTAVPSYWNTRALVLCWKASSCFEHSTQQRFCVSSTPSQGNVYPLGKGFLVRFLRVVRRMHLVLAKSLVIFVWLQ